MSEQSLSVAPLSHQHVGVQCLLAEDVGLCSPVSPACCSFNASLAMIRAPRTIPWDLWWPTLPRQVNIDRSAWRYTQGARGCLTPPPAASLDAAASFVEAGFEALSPVRWEAEPESGKKGQSRGFSASAGAARTRQDWANFFLLPEPLLLLRGDRVVDLSLFALLTLAGEGLKRDSGPQASEGDSA